MHPDIGFAAFRAVGRTRAVSAAMTKRPLAPEPSCRPDGPVLKNSLYFEVAPLLASKS